MKDPRGGSGIAIHIDGDGAWPDLQRKRVMIERPSAIAVAGLARGTQQGHASLMWRLDMPSGRVVMAEMTLRELHGIWVAFVTAYGEGFMKQGLASAASDADERMAMVVIELQRQLLEAKAALGQEPVLDLSRADREYDNLVRRREEASS